MIRIPFFLFNRIYKSLDTNAFVQLFIWKHNVYKQTRRSIIEKGTCLRSKRKSRERVALIKSLIYARWKSHAWGAVARLSWKCQLVVFCCFHLHHFCTNSGTDESEWRNYVLTLQITFLSAYITNWTLFRF